LNAWILIQKAFNVNPSCALAYQAHEVIEDSHGIAVAESFKKEEQWNRAIKLYGQVLRGKKDHLLEARVGLADALFKARKFKQCAHLCTHTLERYPKLDFMLQLRLLRGNSYSSMSQPNLAIIDLEVVHSRAPEQFPKPSVEDIIAKLGFFHISHLLKQGNQYWETKQCMQAREFFFQYAIVVRQLCPQDTSRLLVGFYKLLEIYIYLMEYEKATLYVRKILDLSPDDLTAVLSRSLVAASQHEWDASLRDLHRVIKEYDASIPEFQARIEEHFEALVIQLDSYLQTTPDYSPPNLDPMISFLALAAKDFESRIYISGISSFAWFIIAKFYSTRPEKDELVILHGEKAMASPYSQDQFLEMNLIIGIARGNLNQWKECNLCFQTYLALGGEIHSNHFMLRQMASYHNSLLNLKDSENEAAEIKIPLIEKVILFAPTQELRREYTALRAKTLFQNEQFQSARAEYVLLNQTSLKVPEFVLEIASCDEELGELQKAYELLKSHFDEHGGNKVAAEMDRIKICIANKSAYYYYTLAAEEKSDKKAIEYLNCGLNVLPSDSKVMYNLLSKRAKILFKAKKYKDSLLDCERALDYKEIFEIYELQMQNLICLKHWNRVQELAKLLERKDSKSCGDNKLTIRSLLLDQLKDGRLLLSSKNFHEAVLTFDLGLEMIKAIAPGPIDMLKFLHGKAEALVQLGRSFSAIQVATKILSLDSKDYPAICIRAAEYIKVDEFLLAREDIDRLKEDCTPRVSTVQRGDSKWIRNVNDLQRALSLAKDPKSDLEILGVEYFQDAKTAFRKLSLKYHPDKNPFRERESEIQFKKIVNAWEAIKRRYDLRS
jgi:tetratricopeptide (TPR) repeat protein